MAAVNKSFSSVCMDSLISICYFSLLPIICTFLMYVFFISLKSHIKRAFIDFMVSNFGNSFSSNSRSSKHFHIMHHIIYATLQINLIIQEFGIKSMTFLCRRFCSFLLSINNNGKHDNIEDDRIQDSDFVNYRKNGGVFKYGGVYCKWWWWQMLFLNTIWLSPKSHQQ